MKKCNDVNIRSVPSLSVVLISVFVIVSCQSSRHAEEPHELVAGTVYTDEAASNTLADQPVYIFSYTGEYFHDIESIEVSSDDTTMVASTITNDRGQYLIALPLNNYYVLQTFYEDQESLTFFMHDSFRRDLNVSFGEETRFDIVDTPPTRELPDYGGRSRAN